MLRERILGVLLDRYYEDGEDQWVSFDALAHGLNAKIADVMYEAGVLCERRYAERTGHRGNDLIRLTQKGSDAIPEPH